MRQQCQLCARRRSPAVAINRVARARLYAVINCAAWRACVSARLSALARKRCAFGPADGGDGGGGGDDGGVDQQTDRPMRCNRAHEALNPHLDLARPQ